MSKYAEQAIDLSNKNFSTTMIYDLIQEKTSVLDIGCSTGYLGEVLIEKKWCNVTGVELDRNDARKASTVLNKVITANIESLDPNIFGEQKFDYIIFADVLEHLVDPKKVIRNLAPYLKKQGRIIASVPNIAHISTRLDLLCGRFDYQKKGIMDNTHLHFFTKDTISKLFSENNYTVKTLKCTVNDPLPETIEQYSCNVFPEKETLSIAKKLMEQPDALIYQYIIVAQYTDGKTSNKQITSPCSDQIELHNHNIYKKLQDKIGSLQISNDNTIKKMGELENSLVESELTIHNYMAQLDAIKHSLSWTATAPFRTLSRPFVGAARLVAYLYINRKNIAALSKEIIEEEGLISFARASYNSIKNLLGANKYALSQAAMLINKQYQSWIKKYRPSREELYIQKEEQQGFPRRPLISIIMPTYNSSENHLRDSINSVINQSYPNWELCIADDCSTDKNVQTIIESSAKKDSRIKFVFRETNGNISKASNSALGLATGDYIGLLDHDDILWPNALFEVAKLINENNNALLLYSDEDKMEEDGIQHKDPLLKPGWSPDYLRSINYFNHFTVVKKDLIDKLGGFRKKHEGSQDWDLFLRATDYITNTLAGGNYIEASKRIVHIPKILYSWRISPLSSASVKGAKTAKSNAFANQARSLQNYLDGLKGIKAKAVSTKFSGIWRTRYSIDDSLKVSIVIPTKDSYSYISTCLNSVVNKTSYQNYEFVIVDTGSTDGRVWGLYQKISAKHKDTKVIKWDKPFNFAAVCNFGVDQSSGQYIILLNNDTEVVNNDWIESMLEHAQRPEIGAVGCKLLYPSNRIQHAGVILGTGYSDGRGIASHFFKYWPDSISDFFKVIQIEAIRNFSAVTAACLMVSKEKYLEVKGQDPSFRIAFNDVDFCLRLLKKGYQNLYTPYTILKHHESISVGKLEDGRRDRTEFVEEMEKMKKRWGDIIQSDPFNNKNLAQDRENYELNFKI